MIVKNMARCLHCNDVLISEWVEDKKKCTCGKLIVTGGPVMLLRYKYHENKNITGSILDTDYEELSQHLLTENVK